MIMTESLGMGEKVKQMDIGLTADTRDVNSIKKVIVQMKNDKMLCQKFRENMLKFSPNYNWENAVKVLDEVYQKRS